MYSNVSFCLQCRSTTGVVCLWQKPTAVFDFNLHLVIIGDFVCSKISLAIKRGKIKKVIVLPKNYICNNKIWSDNKGMIVPPKMFTMDVVKLN